MTSKKEENPQAPSQVPATLNDLWKAYPEAEYNRLLPTVANMAITGPVHRMSVRVVEIDTGPPGKPYESKDLYQPKGSKEWALSGRALDKIADAGGMNFHPSGGVEERTDTYIRYKAIGCSRDADGSPRVTTRVYEIDLDAERAVLQKQYRKKAAAKVADKSLQSMDAQAWVDSCVERDIKATKKYMAQLAESGAMNRVIRHRYALKSTYPLAELKKPFAVPCLQFAPDTSDPQVAKLLLERALTAQQQVYGGVIEGLGTIEPDPTAGVALQPPPEQVEPITITGEAVNIGSERVADNQVEPEDAKAEEEPEALAEARQEPPDQPANGLDEALALPAEKPEPEPEMSPQEHYIERRVKEMIMADYQPEALQKMMRNRVTESEYPADTDPAGAIAMWRNVEIKEHFQKALAMVEWWQQEKPRQLKLGDNPDG